MDPRRSERLTETMRQELDELISYELSDPRIDTAGVAEVTISPDARQARIRVLMTGDVESQKQCLEALNGAKSFIRSQLTQRIDLFRIPELHFEAAVSAGLGSRMEHLLKRVRKGRPRDRGEPPASADSPQVAAESPQVAEDKLTSQKKPVS